MRDIMKEVKALLKKDGILIYETFLKRQNSVDGPRNRDYLLDDGARKVETETRTLLSAGRDEK